MFDFGQRRSPIGIAIVVWFATLCAGCTSANENSNGAQTPLPDAANASDASVDDSGDAVDVSVPQAGGGVALNGVYNARHVGRLPAVEGKRVRPYFLIRSGHLAELGEQGCIQLIDDLRIRSVIDLRSETEANAVADAPCVKEDTRYLLAQLPKILPPTEDSYLQTLTAVEPQLATIFEHISESDALPAIVHCVIGRDRAGLVMALALLTLGVPEQPVLTDFVENQEAEVDVEWLQAVIDKVAASGGIEAYLETHGVGAEQIAAFRAQALE